MLILSDSLMSHIDDSLMSHIDDSLNESDPVPEVVRIVCLFDLVETNRKYRYQKAEVNQRVDLIDYFRFYYFR